MALFEFLGREQKLVRDTHPEAAGLAPLALAGIYISAPQVEP